MTLREFLDEDPFSFDSEFDFYRVNEGDVVKIPGTADRLIYSRSGVVVEFSHSLFIDMEKTTHAIENIFPTQEAAIECLIERKKDELNRICEKYNHAKI